MKKTKKLSIALLMASFILSINFCLVSCKKEKKTIVKSDVEKTFTGVQLMDVNRPVFKNEVRTELAKKETDKVLLVPTAGDWQDLDAGSISMRATRVVDVISVDPARVTGSPKVTIVVNEITRAADSVFRANNFQVEAMNYIGGRASL
jgi:hypothetical protein